MRSAFSPQPSALLGLDFQQAKNGLSSWERVKSFFQKLTLLFLFCLFLSATAAGPASTPALAEGDKYYVPPSQFNAALQIMDLGFSNLFGLFQNATGGFQFDANEKTISRMRFALNASSLMLTNQGAQRDLTALLEPRLYPEISFAAAAPASFKDGKAEIKGTLTLHGISKPFTFDATLNNAGKSPRGGGFWGGEGQAVGLSLRGSVKRDDFDLGDPAEEPGRFGDTLQLLLEMQALKQ